MVIVAGDEVLSYAELAQRADAIGALLHDRGIRAGDTVAVLAPAAADTVGAMSDGMPDAVRAVFDIFAGRLRGFVPAPGDRIDVREDRPSV